MKGAIKTIKTKTKFIFFISLRLQKTKVLIQDSLETVARWAKV